MVGGQPSVHLSNSTVQITQSNNAGQLVATLGRVSGREPTEGGGGEFVLEDNGDPCGEEDECDEPGYSDGAIEYEEKIRDRESDAPEEQSLGKTKEKREVLETVCVVPAFGEVGVLKREI